MTNEQISANELEAWKTRRDSAVAYVGKRNEAKTHHALTLWTGEQIGTCRFSSSWRVRSYIGERMYQIYATVNGVQYTGRGFGEGMAVVLRPCAKQ